jgi:TonB family protein
MKSTILAALSIFLTLQLFAKPKDTVIVTRDTINLKGFVYNNAGKPAASLLIESRQRDLKYKYNYFIIARTDSNGYFELKGAKPNDTLRIMDIRYNDVLFQNKGSRFIIIYLPRAEIAEINSLNPIEVKAQRKYPKILPTFHTTNIDILDAGCSVMMYPAFPGGRERFINFIKQRLIYPERAITGNIEGTVEVAFTVGRDGTLINIKVIKGLGYGCEEQIVKILENCPKWSPGISCNRPTSQEETISVKFSLTDN